MASYNRVVLVGNTTRDVELRKIPNGTEVCDLGLAVNDRRRDAQGNPVEETTFVDITLWGRNAVIASEYTRKGSPVLIEGRLKTDTWETDGQKRSKLKVIADRLVLLSSRNGGGASGAPARLTAALRKVIRSLKHSPESTLCVKSSSSPYSALSKCT